jgi:F-type H+-transporting ATPase subunit b
MHFVLSASTGNTQSLTGALGLNWWSLVINGLAFLIVAWLLGRYVYPVLLKALDAKADDYAAASRLKQAADSALEKAEAETKKLISEARNTAEQILGDARDQATDLIKSAESKASAEAERIIANGREQLANDLEAARHELKADTARLVADATRAVLHDRLNHEIDERLISRSLEEVEV